MRKGLFRRGLLFTVLALGAYACFSLSFSSSSRSADSSSTKPLLGDLASNTSASATLLSGSDLAVVFVTTASAAGGSAADAPSSAAAAAAAPTEPAVVDIEAAAAAAGGGNAPLNVTGMLANEWELLSKAVSWSVDAGLERARKHGAARMSVSRAATGDTTASPLEQGWMPPTPPPEQRKVSNIVLFKTHKTGSTTLSSILFRYGIKHNLKFLLPRYHYVDITQPLAPQPPANISLYHHFRSKRSTPEIMSWYKKHLPLAEFITILRDPLARVLSEFHFFWEPEYKNATIVDWMRGDVSLARKEKLSFPQRFHFPSVDLGIRSQEEFDWFVAEGHQLFSRILILEQFDESLILMRRAFGWSMEDVLYLRLLEACTAKKRPWDNLKVKCSTGGELDSEGMDMLMAELAGEYRIYNVAKERLQNELAQQTQEFWNEVALFKSLLKQLSRRCNSLQVPPNPTLNPKWAQQTHAATLDGVRCSVFSLIDIQFEEIVVRRGFNRRSNPKWVDVIGYRPNLSGNSPVWQSLVVAVAAMFALLLFAACWIILILCITSP